MTDTFQSNLSPITTKPKTLTDFVFEALCENIIYGRLQPGERLREAEIGRALGVSRTPTREAFARLEHQNLIQRDASGAYFVTRWNSKILWEVATLRAALEGLAIQLTAANATDADMESLEKIVADMQRFQEHGNPDDLIRLDILFHSHIWKISNHALLQQSLQEIRPQVLLFMHLTRPGDERGYADTHRLLTDLIHKKDGLTASEKIKDHILATARRGILRIENQNEEINNEQK